MQACETNNNTIKTQCNFYLRGCLFVCLFVIQFVTPFSFSGFLILFLLFSAVAIHNGFYFLTPTTSSSVLS